MYYPVIIDKNLEGIYCSWEDCKPHVYKIKGQIRYKKCKTTEDLVKFIIKNMDLKFTEENVKMIHNKLISYNILLDKRVVKKCFNNKREYPSNALQIYVDGSFNKKTGYYSYGLCAIKDGVLIYKESNANNNTEIASMYQVGGELWGALRAIEYAIEQNELDVVIFYDYLGIEMWANGDWKTNKKYTKEYKRKIQEYKKQIDIYFVKVKAHNNIQFNEMADKLAKEAIL